MGVSPSNHDYRSIAADGMYRGAGADLLYGSGGNDGKYGGIGDDRFFGGDDNDFIYGEDGVDDLDGEKGNDYLDGGPGTPDKCNGSDGLSDLTNKQTCEIIIGVPYPFPWPPSVRTAQARTEVRSLPGYGRFAVPLTPLYRDL